MSRWAGMMGRCPGVRLRVLLIILLLKPSNAVWLQGELITGADHSLQCVNDYLFTINCTLHVSPPDSASVTNSYRLTMTDTSEDLEKFECRLKHTTEGYFCSINTSSVMPHDDDYPKIFSDLDAYIISLCHSKDDGSETCELLDDEYEPATNIKPNAPCCLTLSHNSGQYQFIWKSTYEEYSDLTSLTENLQYQLHFYKTGDKDGGITNYNNIENTSFSLDDKKCLPDTEYAARVRSSPNNAHFKGQWSDWSSEVLWRTDSDTKGPPSNPFTFELRMVFVALCVMVTLLALCYIPVKKWRQSTFIPNPAPYFYTLYSDCQGDFKSWVVTHNNTADMMKAEDTLQIDMLINCMDIQDKCTPNSQPQLLDVSTYRNIPTLVCDSNPSGFLCTGSGVGSLSAQGSSLHTAEDSGCWLFSETSLEKEHSWYCNEYCTLSCFQQSGSVPVEHHDSLNA